MVDVYVGLGSNVEPEPNLRRACSALRAVFGPLVLSSPYRNPAVGFAGDDFLNMVASFASDAGADAVERELSRIEHDQGRTRSGGQLGPRTLDLDLLLYGKRVDAPRRLPREDVLDYAFVLGPLVQVAPALVHPVTGQRLARVWQERSAGAALVELGPLPGC